MIIFVNEDAACRNWLTHHRRGYALERRRKRKVDAFVLHSATCAALKEGVGRKPSRSGRWIACSLHRDELELWCRTDRAIQPTPCVACSGAAGETNKAVEQARSRLEREVLDYVLDVAIIHLEPEAKPYTLTVSDVGQCLHKTPGQLAAALGRLSDEGLITAENESKRTTEIGRRRVYPTVAGLQTLPYFADRSRAEVELECRRLHSDH